MVDPKDGSALQVPICFLPSKDEPKAECEAFEKNVKANEVIASGSIFQTFDTMQHGWMAAVRIPSF